MMGQIHLFEYAYGKYKIDKPVRLIELFGGVGSQAMAFKSLGVDFEEYRLVEFDKYAVASYNAIHGTNFQTSDIRKISGSDLGIVDTDKYTYFVTYSFPCQDLSCAGKIRGMKKGAGTRSGLLWEVERLLNETENLPQILLMENVPMVHSEDNMPDFQKWLEFLQSKGYMNYWQDMNAKNYGAGQSRERTFCLSVLGNKYYEFPQRYFPGQPIEYFLEDCVDEKYYYYSDKAKDLIKNLIEEKGSSLLKHTKTKKVELAIELSLRDNRVAEYAGTILTKQRGITNFGGGGVE